MTEASKPEPQETEEEVVGEPELREVDNLVSPLRYTPDPCSTCH